MSAILTTLREISLIVGRHCFHSWCLQSSSFVMLHHDMVDVARWRQLFSCVDMVAAAGVAGSRGVRRPGDVPERRLDEERRETAVHNAEENGSLHSLPVVIIIIIIIIITGELTD